MKKLKLNSFVCNKRANVIAACLASIVHKNKNILNNIIGLHNEDVFALKLFNPRLGI